MTGNDHRRARAPPAAGTADQTTRPPRPRVPRSLSSACGPLGPWPCPEGTSVWEENRPGQSKATDITRPHPALWLRPQPHGSPGPTSLSKDAWLKGGWGQPAGGWGTRRWLLRLSRRTFQAVDSRQGKTTGRASSHTLTHMHRHRMCSHTRSHANTWSHTCTCELTRKHTLMLTRTHTTCAHTQTCTLHVLTCMLTHTMFTCTHTLTLTCDHMLTFTRTHMPHAFTHMLTLTRKHTFTLTCTHTTGAHTHAHTQTCTHCMCSHTCSHEHMLTLTHKHAHTRHMRSRTLMLSHTHCMRSHASHTHAHTHTVATCAHTHMLTPAAAEHLLCARGAGAEPDARLPPHHPAASGGAWLTNKMAYAL